MYLIHQIRIQIIYPLPKLSDIQAHTLCDLFLTLISLHPALNEPLLYSHLHGPLPLLDLPQLLLAALHFHVQLAHKLSHKLLVFQGALRGWGGGSRWKWLRGGLGLLGHDSLEFESDVTISWVLVEVQEGTGVVWEEFLGEGIIEEGFIEVLQVL